MLEILFEKQQRNNMINEDKINYVMDQFDFERVHKAMEALDWKTYSSIDNECNIPNVFQLRQNARALLRQIMKEGIYGLATGGFYATYNNEGVLELSFCIDKVNTLDLDEDKNNVDS